MKTNTKLVICSHYCIIIHQSQLLCVPHSFRLIIRMQLPDTLEDTIWDLHPVHMPKIAMNSRSVFPIETLPYNIRRRVISSERGIIEKFRVSDLMAWITVTYSKIHCLGALSCCMGSHQSPRLIMCCLFLVLMSWSKGCLGKFRTLSLWLSYFWSLS